MILEPMGDNIIIELDKIEEKKEKKLESGLILPGTSISDQEARQDMATVIAVGKGRMLNNGQMIPLTVELGDRVLFNKYAGTQIVIGKSTYLILKECDILAVLRD